MEIAALQTTFLTEPGTDNDDLVKASFQVDEAPRCLGESPVLEAGLG